MAVNRALLLSGKYFEIFKSISRTINGKGTFHFKKMGEGKCPIIIILRLDMIQIRNNGNICL